MACAVEQGLGEPGLLPGGGKGSLDSHFLPDADLNEFMCLFERTDAIPDIGDGLGGKEGPVSSSGSDAFPSGASAASSPVPSGAGHDLLAGQGYVPSLAGQLGLQRGLSAGATSLLGYPHGALYACAVPALAPGAEAYDYAAPQQAVGGAKDGKVTISHSTIEKQRRDRINALIDELRELVPSAAAGKAGDGSADAKRPKHVVLADTISAVRRMQQQLAHDEAELAHLRAVHAQLAAAATESGRSALGGSNAATLAAATAAPPTDAPATSGGSDVSAQSLLQRSLSGPAALKSAASGAAPGSPVAACPELPQAPANLPAAVGVLVEEAPGCFLVKVNCKDRRGLLSDIANALRSLPLQITRAAITTSEGGSVYDVFEIVVEPGAELEGVCALDVQFHVHQALYKWRTSKGAKGSDGEEGDGKRRRSE